MAFKPFKKSTAICSFFIFGIFSLFIRKFVRKADGREILYDFIRFFRTRLFWFILCISELTIIKLELTMAMDYAVSLQRKVIHFVLNYLLCNSSLFYAQFCNINVFINLVQRNKKASLEFYKISRNRLLELRNLTKYTRWNLNSFGIF